MEIKPELPDELLKDYTRPEDLLYMHITPYTPDNDPLQRKLCRISALCVRAGSSRHFSSITRIISKS